MTSTQSKQLDIDPVGREMHAFATELYPFCRSITGNGLRETLRAIQKRIPLDLREVPSGTQVFDWTVPNEWNIREAWIKNARGEQVVDFARNNLHVVSYSAPVRAKLSLAELKPNLFSLPDQPELIPYRTSYYKEEWGFCLAHKDLEQLPDGEYEVYIDSTLAPGSLTLGEYFLAGETTDEVLISAHTCHPSLANDNLSGIALAVALAKALGDKKNRYSYRFLFIPGTIGSITWLALNERNVDNIRHGLVLTCVGDPGSPTYKKSRRGDALIDRAMQHVLKSGGSAHRVIDFYPYGYDERQYCSPGFNLPVGVFMRSQHGRFAEYHTSADNLSFVQPAFLADSFKKVSEVLQILEKNRSYLSRNPKCEPSLGKRGLYGTIGGESKKKELEMAILWVLNLSDGAHSLLDVAERSGLPFALIESAADVLIRHDLLAEVPTELDDAHPSSR